MSHFFTNWGFEALKQVFFLGGEKIVERGGAGVYIGYRVYCHLIHSHKFSTKKTFHATSSVFYMFYVSTSFIFHVLYPKLYVVSYPLYFVEIYPIYFTVFFVLVFVWVFSLFCFIIF